MQLRAMAMARWVSDRPTQPEARARRLAEIRIAFGRALGEHGRSNEAEKSGSQYGRCETALLRRPLHRRLPFLIVFFDCFRSVTLGNFKTVLSPPFRGIGCKLPRATTSMREFLRWRIEKNDAGHH